ncbi:MAG: hypothetical protein MK078_16005 [Crocinitomicaceae bacterium]|nr:hypothetical protein [Crocinitomicaceae bacterium]
MRSVFLLVFLISVAAFGQRKHKAPHYIFDLDIGFKSLLYTGVTNLSSDIVYPSDEIYNVVYTEESWETDYDFSASYGFQAGLGINVISKSSYQLDVTGLVGRGQYNSSANTNRIGDNGIISPNANNYYSDEFISTQTGGSFQHLGSESLAQVVLRNEIRVFNNFWIGPQIGWQYVLRYGDQPSTSAGYVPILHERDLDIIKTHQLFLGIVLSQKVRQFSFDLSISQTFLTVDKMKTAGNWNDDPLRSPSSLNLDYRFPTVVDFTVGFSFFQQKNGCGTCPNW